MDELICRYKDAGYIGCKRGCNKSNYIECFNFIELEKFVWSKDAAEKVKIIEDALVLSKKEINDRLKNYIEEQNKLVQKNKIRQAMQRIKDDFCYLNINGFMIKVSQDKLEDLLKDCEIVD